MGLDNILEQFLQTQEAKKREKKAVPIERWLEDEFYIGPDGVFIYDFWKEKVADLFNSKTPINEILIDGSIGCLNEFTRIPTSIGLLSLKELDKRFKKGERFQVLSEEGFRNVVHVHDEGIRDTIGILTSLGKSIEGTVRHRFRVITDEGIVWKRLDEIKIGDKLKLIRDEAPFGSVSIPKAQAYTLGHFLGYKVSVMAQVFTWNRASISAFLRGIFDDKSFITSKGVSIQSASEKLIIQVSELLSLFGIHSKIYEVVDMNSFIDYRLSIIDSVSVNIFIDNIGSNKEANIEAMDLFVEMHKNDEDLVYDTVIDIYNSRSYTRDLTVEGSPTYCIKGLISHNTGKSTFAQIVLTRKLYEISCLPHPQNYFSLMNKTKIAFIYFSLMQKTARDLGFQEIKNFIDNIPYFQEEFKRAELKGNIYFPQSNIGVQYGSTIKDSIGTALIGAILDEANFFGNIRGEEEFSKITQLYNNTVQRAQSRFLIRGVDHSLSIIVSSSTTATSFTEKKKVEFMSKPNAMVIESRLWDVKPKGTYSDKRFYVFVGSELYEPCIVNNTSDVVSYLSSVGVEIKPGRSFSEGNYTSLEDDIRNKFLAIPVDFRSQFEKDIITAIQNIGGGVTQPMGKLFSSKTLYSQITDAAATYGLKHQFTSNQFVVATQDAGQITDYYRPNILDRNVPRFFHIDQSITSDKTGVASAYPKMINNKLFIIVDMMISIKPPMKPRKISISKIREFILHLKKNSRFNIKKVTYDSFACLTGDTLVKLDIGNKYIKDVQIGDRVLNDSGACRVLNRFEYKDAPIMRVETCRGKVLEGTYNHRIRVLDKWSESKVYKEEFDKNRIWSNKITVHKRRPIWKFKRFDELLNGDILDVEYFKEDIGNDIDFSSVGLSNPEIVMYLIGFALGDAHICEDGFNYIFGDIETATHVMSLVREVTGKESKITPANVTCFRGSLSSRKFIRFINDMGLKCVNALHKRIPETFKNLKSKYLISLLNGYIDSDGSVSKDGGIRFTSISKGLLEDIKYICEYRLGLKCVVDKNATKGEYRMYPNNKMYFAKPQYHAGIHGQNISTLVCGSSFKLRNSEIKEGRYIYDRVQKVEKVGNKDVYDIQIDKENAYFANGVYSHNSEESIQHFEESGIDSHNFSVDKTDEEYKSFINLIYEDRILFYHHPVLEAELFDVVHYREKRKVDHTEYGSKDLLDAVVGAVYHALVFAKENKYFIADPAFDEANADTEFDFLTEDLEDRDGFTDDSYILRGGIFY